MTICNQLAIAVQYTHTSHVDVPRISTHTHTIPCFVMLVTFPSGLYWMLDVCFSLGKQHHKAIVLPVCVWVCVWVWMLTCTERASIQDSEEKIKCSSKTLANPSLYCCVSHSQITADVSVNEIYIFSVTESPLIYVFHPSLICFVVPDKG